MVIRTPKSGHLIVHLAWYRSGGCFFVMQRGGWQHLVAIRNLYRSCPVRFFLLTD